ncbi:MAG: Hint domain-containing protein [Pyrinomonadaceae bacterium]
MNTLLTQAQQEALFSFHGSSTPGATTYLNPSDSTHSEIINTMLAASGRTADAYPHLFGSMNGGASDTATSGGSYADSDLDKVHLVDAGRTSSGQATATVWSRSSGDSMVNLGNLMVFDADSGELLAQGDNSSVRNGFLACQTQPDTAASAGKNLSILYVGHVTDGDGSTRSFSYANTVANPIQTAAATVETGETAIAADAGENAIQATVTQPVIIHQQNIDIWIAVGRTTANPPPANTDYIYVEPSTENNPYLIVPFVGSVALSGAIDLPSLTASDLQTYVFINNGQGGTVEVGRASQYTTDAKLVGGFSVGSPDSPGFPSNVLQWKFPHDAKGYQSTSSIVYNPTPNGLGNEVDSFFYFAFASIPLQGGDVAPPFFVCSVDTPNEPSINCTKIPNLYFWWHCLSKGTLVELEDGDLVPIEEINETYRVKCGTGKKSLAVVATVLGRHSSDGNDNQIFRLTTDNGKTITATACHTVFMSPDNCRMIAHIVAGDSIVTDEGMSTVVSIEQVAEDTMFYGLALGSPDEMASRDFPKDMASYYGNGILCGDQLALRANAKSAYHDLDYILPRIDEMLHQDYTSALQQKRF